MPLFGPEEGGRQTKIGWSRPKTAIFWPFLAFGGRLGGLKDSWRCKLGMKLVKLLMGHILKAFRAKKIGPGWQGGSETNFGVEA